MGCRTRDKTRIYQYIRDCQEDAIDLNAMSTELRIGLNEIKGIMKELSDERLTEWKRIQEPAK